MKKRNTQTKKKVWDIISNTPYALCHEDIVSVVKNEIDRVTVYRILLSFCEDGLIHKIVDMSGKTFYAICHEKCCTQKHDDNHIHFKCIKCEHITCLQQEVSPTLPLGYDLTEINCIVQGVCPQCKSIEIA